MISGEQIVLIFFRIINLGVLIGLFFYLYKRYGLPVIKQNYDTYRSYFQTLLHTHYDLLRQERRVEKKIENDAKEQDALKERLMRWLASVDDQNKLLSIDREERKKKLKEQMMMQKKTITQNRILEIVTSDALAQARTTLELYAKDETFQIKMFDKMRSMMQE